MHSSFNLKPEETAMNLQSALGLSLAGLSLVCSIGFLMHAPDVPDSQPDIPTAPRSYVELMPSSSGERYRIHHLNAQGAETMIRIKYQDFSEGVLTIGPHGKTIDESRSFPDGTPRKVAFYDDDGALRAGHELRLDRTLLWEAKTSSDKKKYLTTVYWPDRRIFLETTYDFDSHVSTSVYRRNDGSIWQVSEHVKSELRTMKQYDEQGRLRITKTKMPRDSAEIKDTEIFYHAGPWSVMKVVYLKEDGQTDFVQWVAYAGRYYWEESSKVPNPNPLMIAGVEEYLDGKMIGRYQLDGDQRIRMIEEIQPDGLIRRRHADRRGKIFREEIKTSRGTSSQYDYNFAFGNVPKLDQRFLVRLTDDDIPARRFNEQEAALRKASEERLAEEALRKALRERFAAPEQNDLSDPKNTKDAKDPTAQ